MIKGIQSQAVRFRHIFAGGPDEMAAPALWSSGWKQAMMVSYN